MATYHLSLKNGIVGAAKNHAEYIMRLGRYSDKSRREELKYHNSNLPHWANDAVDFFEKADIYERVNGRAYVEFEIALPNEIDIEDNINIVERFIENNIGMNRVWAYAVHSKVAAFDDSQEQIHAHIMFSERIVTDEMEEALNPSKFFKRYNPKNPDRGGYKKDRRYSDKKCSSNNLKNVRKDWEAITNSKYEERKINKKISSESLSKQKQEAEKIYDYTLASLLDREPQKHLGPKVSNIVKKAIKNKNINQDTLDDVLDEIYLISTKAFCLVIDQIEKEKKEVEYRKEMKQREMIMNNQISDAASVCNDEDGIIIVEGRSIVNTVNIIEETLLSKVSKIEEEIQKMNKLMLTEKQIGFMALSICTKGRSKKLMKRRRKLDKCRKEFEEELSILVNGKKPYFWQFEEKRNYEKEIEKISNKIGDIEEELNYLRKETEKINELMKEEINRKRMIVIINKLKERQKARIEYVEVLKVQQKMYVEMTCKCEPIIKGFDQQKYYKMPGDFYSAASRIQHDLDQNEIIKCLDSFEKMLKQAERENDFNAKIANNLKVKLSVTKDKQGSQFEI